MEKPIIFNTEMVQAILDGRKAMTRRPIKPQPPERYNNGFQVFQPNQFLPDYSGYLWLDGWAHWRPKQPYTVGDRLWVRETWAMVGWVEGCDGVASPIHYLRDSNGMERKVIYYEDCPDWRWLDDEGFSAERQDGSEASYWKPSIHMPRWAARLFLEVTGVRVERVQDISEGDIIAEGCPNAYLLGGSWYRPLWDSIYAKRGLDWDANPWVWVYEFKRTDPCP